MGANGEAEDIVEDGLKRQASLSRDVMAVFDALPGELRRFVAEYPQGLPMGGARGVAQAWNASEGDAALVMHVMQRRFPAEAA